MKKQQEESERPFIMVNGRRYVLDSEEESLDLRSLPLNPKLATIPSPPRTVSFTAMIMLFLSSTTGAYFGRFWLCVVLFFLIGFCGMGRVGSFFYERIGRWEPFANARLVSCDKTKVQINGSTPHILRFEGTAPDGSAFKGVSYSFQFFKPDQTVEIERRLGTQDVLRVKGTSISIFGTSFGSIVFVMAVLGIFILIGVYLAIYTPMRYGFKALPLLRFGRVAQGVPVQISNTGVKVNNTPEQAVTYRFLASDGKEYRAFAKALNIEKLTDEGSEILFYHEENPERSILLDDLPQGLKMLPEGRFNANPLRLIMPLLFLAIVLFELILTLIMSFHVEKAIFPPAF